MLHCLEFCDIKSNAGQMHRLPLTIALHGGNLRKDPPVGSILAEHTIMTTVAVHDTSNMLVQRRSHLRPIIRMNERQPGRSGPKRAIRHAADHFVTLVIAPALPRSGVRLPNPNVHLLSGYSEAFLAGSECRLTLRKCVQLLGGATAFFYFDEKLRGMLLYFEIESTVFVDS